MNDVNPFRRLRAVPEEQVATPESFLAAAALGDERAFGDLYDSLAATVHGVVVRVVRDPAIAQEVTQEVFVELWRLAPRFDPARGSAAGWASTIAHRRAVDRVRSEQARRTREEVDASQRSVPYDEVVEEVEDRADKSLVAASLDALTEHQREAVSLAYYGGHTYKEVAVLLDVPEGTVKTRIRDGLIKLRDQFGVTT
ncbi:MAG: ECF RNA polymerase sigma factor SigK [Actinomycetota bacterium]